MKYLLVTFTLFFTCLSLSAQESSITLSGGYSFGNIELSDESTSGWRINAYYEFGHKSNFSHGVSIGYISTKVSTYKLVDSEAELKSGHLPIYYSPKYVFGKSETFEPFIKGALGMHVSTYDFEFALIEEIIDTADLGFYGGLGAGLSINVNSKVLINLEYEWAYLSDSWYRDGFSNSLMIGVGFKL